MRSLLLFAFVLALTVAAFAQQTPAGPAKVDTARADPVTAPSPTPAIAPQELAGLWEAKRRFGPDVRGTLIIRTTKNYSSAEIVGHIANVKVAGSTVSFELADEKNSFRGTFTADRTRISGHWIQPANYASPVTLTRIGDRNEWRGTVSPFDETFTLYLAIKPREDGSLGAFLRNPERNIGVNQYAVDRVERQGDSIKLLAAAKGDRPGRTLTEGKYDPRTKVLSIAFPNRGGTFDFKRVQAGSPSDFYPRGRSPGPRYSYNPPYSFDDGWPTASLEDVGISTQGMEKFIQMVIDTPIDSIHAPEIHGIVIIRHGKLVLEEYFHGEHRDKPHDLRSASKSVTSTLVGAAINAGLPVKLDSPVYQVMNGGQLPPDIEERKRAIMLEHLLTMSSGLDCNDEDESSPGNEEKMQELQGKADYYKFIMDLKMIRNAGEKAAYCSGGANLAGGVLARATGRSLLELTDSLFANPLGIKQYHMPITPTGDAYMGGGMRLRLRDFAKLAQLYLSNGQWNGHQLLTAEWCRRATSPRYKFYETSKAGYGYLWWTYEFPYRGRTVRAYWASGLGWQNSIAIPELDLVIAVNAGNYADDLPLYKDYVPNWILPAVQ